MKTWGTPRRKWMIWLLAIVWLLLQPVAGWMFYGTNFRRGIYPPEADTIVIGQMQLLVGWFVSLPFFLVFFWFCFRQYPGSISLIAFTRTRPVWCGFWTLLLLAMAALEFQALTRAIMLFFPLDVFTESLTIYLLLCCRSCLMYSRVGLSQESGSGSVESGTC